MVALLFIPITITLYVLTFGIGLILMNYGVTIQDLSNVTNIFPVDDLLHVGSVL